MPSQGAYAGRFAAGTSGCIVGITVPIYLDWNATAPISPAAADMFARVLAGGPGNASSIHRVGQAAKARLDDARDAVAALVGGDAAEVVFTSGGSESDNLALRGVLAAAPPTRQRLVVTALEHDAVINTARALAAEGRPVTVVAVEANGAVDPGRLADAVGDDTALVSVMLANNETGVIQAVDACARHARACGALVHTDAVQAAGKIPIAVRALGVDLLSVSAHKFGGPHGAGALWIRRGVAVRAQITGGRQERGRRAGTENVAAVAAMGVAAHEARAAAAAGEGPVAARRDRLERELLAAIDGAVVNGAGAPRIPNTSNISFPGVEGESLVIALDLEGIAVSTGSACASGSLEPSHVLRAMHLPPARVQSAVRFSLGPTTTDDDITIVVAAVTRAVARLRRLSSGRR